MSDTTPTQPAEPTGPRILGREQILQALDLAEQVIEVPEWGGSVRVRELSGSARDAMMAAVVGAEGKVDMEAYRARLIAASICDDSGRPLFTPEDAALLGRKSAKALDRVYRAAEAINAMGGEAVKAAAGN